jgi:quinolinate synthase
MSTNDRDPVRATVESVKQARERMGDRLVLLVHHYQRKEIVALADFVGDSYALSRKAAESLSTHVVFCGVHFMAESASILARPGQAVYLPDPHAGCPMADMADPADVETALATLARLAPGRRISVVAYVNSSAEVKAIAGRNNGICCTSSSAIPAMEWARKQGDLVLFLPDFHLGNNTAAQMGIRPVATWNPHEENGGLTSARVAGASLVLWNGYCHVHTFFTPEHVAAARKRFQGARVIVHPECHRPVVEAADASGSTSAIARIVQTASPGETIVVGTEVNFVARLARDFPWVQVVPLAHSVCPNMYRTTPEKLARVLDTFDERFRVDVDEEVRQDALLALSRMLAIGIS